MSSKPVEEADDFIVAPDTALRQRETDWMQFFQKHAQAASAEAARVDPDADETALGMDDLLEISGEDARSEPESVSERSFVQERGGGGDAAHPAEETDSEEDDSGEELDEAQTKKMVQDACQRRRDQWAASGLDIPSAQLPTDPDPLTAPHATIQRWLGQTLLPFGGSLGAGGAANVTMHESRSTVTSSSSSMVHNSCARPTASAAHRSGLPLRQQLQQRQQFAEHRTETVTTIVQRVLFTSSAMPPQPPEGHTMLAITDSPLSDNVFVSPLPPAAEPVAKKVKKAMERRVEVTPTKLGKGPKRKSPKMPESRESSEESSATEGGNGGNGDFYDATGEAVVFRLPDRDRLHRIGEVFRKTPRFDGETKTMRAAAKDADVTRPRGRNLEEALERLPIKSCLKSAIKAQPRDEKKDEMIVKRKAGRPAKNSETTDPKLELAAKSPSASEESSSSDKPEVRTTRSKAKAKKSKDKKKRQKSSSKPAKAQSIDDEINSKQTAEQPSKSSQKPSKLAAEEQLSLEQNIKADKKTHSQKRESTEEGTNGKQKSDELRPTMAKSKSSKQKKHPLEQHHGKNVAKVTEKFESTESIHSNKPCNNERTTKESIEESRPAKLTKHSRRNKHNSQTAPDCSDDELIVDLQRLDFKSDASERESDDQRQQGGTPHRSRSRTRSVRDPPVDRKTTNKRPPSKTTSQIKHPALHDVKRVENMIKNCLSDSMQRLSVEAKSESKEPAKQIEGNDRPQDKVNQPNAKESNDHKDNKAGKSKKVSKHGKENKALPLQPVHPNHKSNQSKQLDGQVDEAPNQVEGKTLTTAGNSKNIGEPGKENKALTLQPVHPKHRSNQAKTIDEQGDMGPKQIEGNTESKAHRNVKTKQNRHRNEKSEEKATRPPPTLENAASPKEIEGIESGTKRNKSGPNRDEKLSVKPSSNQPASQKPAAPSAIVIDPPPRRDSHLAMPPPRFPAPKSKPTSAKSKPPKSIETPLATPTPVKSKPAGPTPSIEVSLAPTKAPVTNESQQSTDTTVYRQIAAPTVFNTNNTLSTATQQQQQSSGSGAGDFALQLCSTANSSAPLHNMTNSVLSASSNSSVANTSRALRPANPLKRTIVLYDPALEPGSTSTANRSGSVTLSIAQICAKMRVSAEQRAVLFPNKRDDQSVELPANRVSTINWVPKPVAAQKAPKTGGETTSDDDDDDDDDDLDDEDVMDMFRWLPWIELK